MYRKVLTPNFVSVLVFLVIVLVVANVSITGAKIYEPNNKTEAIVSGGTITGSVRFPEEYPDRQKLTITKDQAVCGAFQYSELFVVSEENHGLKNVVVSLLGAKGKKPEAGMATLNQKKCQYVPHVQAVPVGTTLEILNNDGLLHNVHGYLESLDPQSTVFNKAQPKFLKKIKQTLDKPGTYYFKCDVHSHMSAYIAVMAHPFYDVTDADGRFTITNVRPGSYTVQAWHEELGTLEKTVTVTSGKTAEITFDILPGE